MMLRTTLTLLLWVTAPAALALEWRDIWFTPDQQGQRLMDRGEFAGAASRFTSLERKGAALYMAGDFQSAAAVWGRSNTAFAHYNRGNALVLLGEYDNAIAAYREALQKRPRWEEAQQNLQIALLRQQALARPTDDAGGTGGMLAADEFVFDQGGRNTASSDEQLMDAADQQLGEDAMRALWLRKVETRPADFLAAKFNYQMSTRQTAQPLTGDGEEP